MISIKGGAAGQCLPLAAKFELKDANVWGATMLRTEDGICHLIFSTWPKSLGHMAWATHSELGYATAEQPGGPYRFQGMALTRDNGDRWDSGGMHNECLIEAKGKYYLYYNGQRGNGEWWDHRNHQRVGVAVADHPSGPWRRFDRPLIEPKPGHLLTATPNVFLRPDGRYQMVYKTVTAGPPPFGGSVRHVIALADSPLGPFVDQPEPFIRRPATHFPIDDHVEWAQDGAYYAIVKDNQGEFTGHTGAMILFRSADGLAWELERDPVVMLPQITWEDGRTQAFDRLEMPKLHMEKGTPTHLFLAGLPRGEDDSFMVAVPLIS
ncbi:glycoside hydrolase family protein [Paenibacillus sp. YN15]|uniref:glycoside hydrolase family protein n=1 Tax=Paenibacillus sp. YN15 TaxID=1742774 RepID=UPI000DCBCCF1|nr:glycoside hydrolase family protein [Paenibacillus sp. YN15]RAU93699.1 sucrase [Paenibacillus sp. YN15]